jgi:hypothetical protein
MWLNWKFFHLEAALNEHNTRIMSRHTDEIAYFDAILSRNSCPPLDLAGGDFLMHNQGEPQGTRRFYTKHNGFIATHL